MIREFEHAPRLTEVPEAQREATRLRWIAAATQALRKRGIGTPRQRRDAQEPITFARWRLSGNGPFQEFAAHPLIADRDVRWLTVDSRDVVTIAESP